MCVGGGGGGEREEGGINRSSARSDPQRDHQPQRQQQCQGGGYPASAEQPVYFANCCFNSCAEQSHKVLRTVEKQPKLHESPDPTSLLLLSPGLS